MLVGCRFAVVCLYYFILGVYDWLLVDQFGLCALLLVVWGIYLTATFCFGCVLGSCV